MRRLAEKIVLRGLVMAWRLAAWPTRRSPSLVKATTEGVVRAPSALSRTTGCPPSITAMQELVVPRSIPKILLMCSCLIEGLAGVRFPRFLAQLLCKACAIRLNQILGY